MKISQITSEIKRIRKAEGPLSPDLIPLQEKLISALLAQCEHLQKICDGQQAFINGTAKMVLKSGDTQTEVTLEYQDIGKTVDDILNQ